MTIIKTDLPMAHCQILFAVLGIVFLFLLLWALSVVLFVDIFIFLFLGVHLVFLVLFQRH